MSQQWNTSLECTRLWVPSQVPQIKRRGWGGGRREEEEEEEQEDKEEERKEKEGGGGREGKTIMHQRKGKWFETWRVDDTAVSLLWW